MNNIESSTGEIVMYQPDETIRLEVRVENETVWLTQQQMADLFLTTRNNITLHIGNIFKDGELVETAVRKDSLLTATDGKKYRTKYTIWMLLSLLVIGLNLKGVLNSLQNYHPLHILLSLQEYLTHLQLVRNSCKDMNLQNLSSI